MNCKGNKGSMVNMFMKKCPFCKKEFESNSGRKIFCCSEHQKLYKNLLRFPNDSDYISCKICGWRANNLNSHIKHAHNITIKDYCDTFNLNDIDIVSLSFRKQNSETQKRAYLNGHVQGFRKGDLNNPFRSENAKNGRYSPFSMNFNKYDGLSDEEKIKKINELKSKCVSKKEKNNTNPLSVNYYTSKGFSLDEAKQKIKERQTTFSLKKCIERYGLEKGKEIFEERQRKWQNTLNNLPQEELERIIKAKMFDGKGYSNISQELFNKINEKIVNDYKEIFYATNNLEKTNNNEFLVIDPKTQKKYLLDFYIKDINKVIEFDGDYWHGEKRGNQERDRIREENLNRLGYTQIYRVKERDYLKNPEQTIDECIRFIKGNDYETVRYS